MAIRIIADILIINVVWAIALTMRFLWVIATNEVLLPTQEIFDSFLATYFNTFWVLTLTSLVVFFFSGFYTYGRFYKSRFKVIVVAQAVSLNYLLFGFFVFFIYWGKGASLPRSSIVLGWFISLLALIGVRLWSIIWKKVVNKEAQSLTIGSVDHIKNVLVVGGAGYIGSALLPKLLERNYNVRALDLLLFGTEPIREVMGHPNLEVIKADFRQVDKVVEAMHGIDSVIHLGAIVGDPACALDEKLTIDINLISTQMIAAVAKGSGVRRLIFASTCSVYGENDEILDEQSTLNPVSLYAQSKIASEQVLWKMADDTFASTIVRFGTIYGLSGRTRFDLVVNLLAAKALVDGKITVFGGDQWRPFLHVDDAAQALFRLLECPIALVRNETFNVGSNEQNHTIYDVGKMIQEAVPTAELIDYGSDSDKRNYRVNFDKISSVVGFKAQWTIEEGIQQVIEAIKNGDVSDYTDSRYSNVKFLCEQCTAELIRSHDNWAYDLAPPSSSDPMITGPTI
jgi:nucleoside-diphosphate-sugar epimerase